MVRQVKLIACSRRRNTFERETFLPTTLDSLCPGRHAALQLFKPVQHDLALPRCRLRLLAGLEHQEALAIGRNVVIGKCVRECRQVLFLKERSGLARSEVRLGGNVHGHHLVVAAEEKRLPLILGNLLILGNAKAAKTYRMGARHVQKHAKILRDGFSHSHSCHQTEG